MWKPIETEVDLPSIGARETTRLDFKSKPTSDRFEAARDVAAFANAEGGTLLIGAAGGDHLVRYEPLSTEDAKTTQRVYDEAVRDRCTPGPLFSFAEVRSGGGVVLAVNVSPFPGQVVGVRLKKEEMSCGTSGTQQEGVFLFPLRVGTHTRSITPEQIPMFIDPRARRVAICLGEAVGKQVILFATKYRSEKNTWIEIATIQSVDLIGNAVTMNVGSTPNWRVTVPLDVIDAACRTDNTWHVFMRGVFKPMQWAGTAPPPLQALELIFDPNG